MADARITSLGFKEWAGVIRALEEGDQICLLRKGTREHRRFDPDQRRFWLVPTYDRQSKEMFQPPYRSYVEESEQEQQQRPRGKIRVGSWAEAKYMIQVRKMERLNLLTDYTVYSPRCFQEGFQFRPGQVLYLLVLRVYNLDEPRVLDAPSDYQGYLRRGDLEEEGERNLRGSLKLSVEISEEGREWTHLRQRIPLQANHPAVPGEEFERRKQQIRDTLIRPGERQPEPWLF